MDGCRNTGEAAVRSQERAREIDQDKENLQGSEVRDVVGEIQKLQEKQAKDMRRKDEEMSDEDMEGTEANRKTLKEYESASAENGRLQMTTQVSERNHESVVIGAAYAPHLKPH
ncbi:hypothetical protein V3C99_004812, partial [Haemonchus contortus]